jgi:signal transduction histidine kinase
MLGGRRRWWREHWLDVIFDGAPPLLLLSLGLIDALTGSLAVPIGDAPVASALLPGAIACLALLLRRYRPLLTLGIVLLAALMPPLLVPTTLTYWDEFVVWMVALYSCARHRGPVPAFAALAASAVGMVVLPFEFAELRDAGDLLFNSMLLAAAFGIGLLARSWAASRERVMRAALDRALAEERASRSERARIARELHDVIAHTITVIVMQAGGARLASRTDSSIAISTLARIEELGRTSLAELRSLLPLLREDDDELPARPQPNLEDVQGLCEQMRQLGLPVTLRMDGDLGAVPLGLQLTGYRVVQEGLTNVIKHSGLVDTVVRVGRSGSPERLIVDIGNDIPADAHHTGGSAGGITGAGRGLLGLQERVGLAGGRFTAGRVDRERFRLHVELPIEAAAA